MAIPGLVIAWLTFTDEKGDPISRNALGHMGRRSAERSGLKGFAPHGLRHYAASVMIDQAPASRLYNTISGTHQRRRLSTPMPVCGANPKGQPGAPSMPVCRGPCHPRATTWPKRRSADDLPGGSLVAGV